jgi:hypothetical protein
MRLFISVGIVLFAGLVVCGQKSNLANGAMKIVTLKDDDAVYVLANELGQQLSKAVRARSVIEIQGFGTPWNGSRAHKPVGEKMLAKHR